jgi:hypothetical protein
MGEQDNVLHMLGVRPRSLRDILLPEGANDLSNAQGKSCVVTLSMVSIVIQESFVEAKHCSILHASCNIFSTVDNYLDYCSADEQEGSTTPYQDHLSQALAENLEAHAQLDLDDPA